MTSKVESKLRRFIKAPIRALDKAMSMYARSIMGCAGRMQPGAGTSYGRSSRSYSFHSAAGSSSRDLQELIRAASVQGARGEATVVPRSQSVAVGRIDEDAEVEFTGEVKVGSSLLFPRSQSYAVAGAKKRARVIALPKLNTNI